jgi:glycosyltransferase involved in cell wall biosynthesis
MNILVLTNVLPAPVLTKNVRENDVLIQTANLHESMYKDVKYTFVFVLSTSYLTHLMPDKHQEHKAFLDLKKYTYEGREIEIIGVPAHRLNTIMWPFYIHMAYLKNRKVLSRIIAENNIDVIHAHNIMGDVGMAYHLSKSHNIPYVVTVRQFGRVEHFQERVKKFVAGAKAVISLGYNEQEKVRNWNTNLQLISHGVDERFLSQQKTYAIGDTLRIVSICRLLDWKNLDQVIYALDQIKEGFTYDIYGDGPYEARLKEIVAKSGISNRVTFHGYIDYELVPQTLASYDLFVLPSFTELFGRVYIEAMACGLPIVGARKTGMDGYIIEGEQGFLVDHTDVSEVKAAILRFITDKSLKITMGKKAKIFSQDFSWSSVITRLDNLYRSVQK